MKIKRSSLVVMLALAPVWFLTEARASNLPWWEDYSNKAEFTGALPYIGYSMDALQADPEQGLKDSADSRTPLYWLKRTMQMYPLSSLDSYNMPVAHHETKDWTNGLYATMGRGIFYFTRTLGDKGQTIYISAGNIPQGANCYVATGGRGFAADKEYLNQVALKPNTKTAYTFQENGILALGCGDPQKQHNNVFVNLTVHGGQKSHLYILGQSAPADWAESKKVAADTGSAYLFDGRANVVVPKQIALVAKDDINKTLGDTLRTVSLYEKINGMDGSEAMFTSSQGSMLWNYEACCSARYRNGVANIKFYSDSIQGSGISWGIWHEIGHLYEPFREYLTLFPEIQVNRYSLEACRLFKKEVTPAQCHGDLKDYPNWDKKSVINFLASSQIYDDYDSVKNKPFEGLKFFAYLQFSYGETFFPKVNQARLKAVYEAPGSTMAEKYNVVMGNKQRLIDFSIVAYSQAAGEDLRQYFSRWGLHFSDAASEKVAALNLPQPGESDGNTDLPVASVPADVTVKTSTSGSGVYTLDGSKSLNAVNHTWRSLTPGFWLQKENKGGWHRVITGMPTVRALYPENVTGVAEYELTVENADGKTDSKIVKVTVVKEEQNHDAAFIAGLRALNLAAQDNGDRVSFSGSATSSAQFTSTPAYQWSLPAGAQGASQGQASQRFTVVKTAQPQTLKVSVEVKAGKEKRTLTQTLTVPAASSGSHPAWVYGTQYQTGAVVQHKGKVFECIIDSWCSQTGPYSQLHYEPGVGLNWTMAWKYH
uniref:M60 family metallopeptidase n=1 Tax=Scandinavium goeteborgense TaxID=1851514 RepID=UPI001357F907|nr:M60 family metallopeptidase [Scandinavium goeteborgense]